jgi:hypothetical protein
LAANSIIGFLFADRNMYMSYMFFNMMFCMSRNIPHPPIPSATDNIKEKEAFKHKAVISSKKAVAGNPHNTPNKKLLKYDGVSP